MATNKVDTILKKVAHVLLEISRKSDIVARYGGEEFIVGLLNFDEASSLMAAERIRKAIETIDDTANITASIGITTLTNELHQLEISQLYEKLVKQSDRAMYAAKMRGRNQVCHFNSLTI